MARWSREITTLRDARREFARNKSPWMLGTAIVAVAVARVLVGDPSWRDAVAIAAMLALYPFGEWAIHVFLLHRKPTERFGRRIDPSAAREHRAHHAEPNDLSMILLEPHQIAGLLLVAVPLELGLGALVVGALAGPVPFGALLSGALAAYCAVFVYEWTHFLIHTAHRPRSRWYRSIWRTHRLHHFKNEHYWHGITQNLSDRVLGTFPDQSSVPRSPTARSLDSGPTG